MPVSDLTELEDATDLADAAPTITVLAGLAGEVNGGYRGSSKPPLRLRLPWGLSKPELAPDDPTLADAAHDDTCVDATEPGATAIEPELATTGEPAPALPSALSGSLLGGVVAELVGESLLTERRAIALGFQARETGETVLRVMAREIAAVELTPIYEFLGRRFGQPMIRHKNDLIDRVIEAPWLPIALTEQRMILALKGDAGTALYATLDPGDLLLRDWVGRISGQQAVPVPVLPDVLMETVRRLRTRSELRESGKELIPINIDWAQEERIRSSPEGCDIPTLVDFIVHTAYEHGTSDIHIEPVEDGTVVRGRIDGMLHEDCRFPLALHAAITSRIKVLAGMDVAERRRPQDGRITAQIRQVALDIRVSSSPTVLGEKIVMRLLDEKALRPTPEQLGLRDGMLRTLLDKISAPHGLIMISGPTGSGKTTTLYSCLSALDRQRRNVLTIEDPVEYRLKGVHQMQVNDRIGLTFASGLRNILRQDPDVIMVGECRDVDTARMAIQASLTGHTVFSTIHANDAVGVISRLLDMDIDPYLVATALSLPVAQRLVRALCPRCRTTVDGSEMQAMLRTDGVSDEKLTRMGIFIDPRETCQHAPGCPNCRHTGYAGRQAVYEMFEITEPMRDLIAAKTFSGDDMRRMVREGGNVSIVENALALVEEGITTYAEVVRVFGDGAT